MVVWMRGHTQPVGSVEFNKRELHSPKTQYKLCALRSKRANTLLVCGRYLEAMGERCVRQSDDGMGRVSKRSWARRGSRLSRYALSVYWERGL